MDRYEIKGRIGRGGIGAIYHGYDHLLHREVAIKRLLPFKNTTLNEADGESLKREAVALAKFQHPNVLTVYEFEEDEEGPYIITELIRGENLKVIIEKGALTLNDFYELAAQSLHALIGASDLNLLHRDIKPSNIMLYQRPGGGFQIKILDFGLAKFSAEASHQTLDQKGSFLGSIDFIAPEQVERQALDQRTDLYSLGCVFYFCLTQSAPFHGDSLAKTLENHLQNRFTRIENLRSDLPQPVAEWINRLLSRYPKDRPHDALDALKGLESAQRSETIAPPKPSAIPLVTPNSQSVSENHHNPSPPTLIEKFSANRKVIIYTSILGLILLALIFLLLF